MPHKPGYKPPNAGKGRPKGAPNKFTSSFKEALLLAFQGIGGTEALTVWGAANPTEFYKIAARLIPHEVVGPGPDGAHLIKKVVHEHHDANGKPIS